MEYDFKFSWCKMKSDSHCTQIRSHSNISTCKCNAFSVVMCDANSIDMEI